MAQGKTAKKKNKRNEKRKQKANADVKREEERESVGVRANESWPGSDSVPPPPL